jgi:aconitate hydratase
MPAGQRLKYRSNIKKYSSYVFEPADPTFPARCLENKPRGIVNVVVAGLSYGQGSSREHAAICPEYLGVKLVVAKSFERIHRQNLVNSGIVPLTFANLDDYDRVKQGDRLRVRQARRQLERGERITIASESGEYEIELVSDLSESERATVLAGGLLNAIRLAEAR